MKRGFAYYTSSSIGSLRKNGFKVVGNYKESCFVGDSKIMWYEVILEKGNFACYIISNRIIAEEAMSKFCYRRGNKRVRHSLEQILAMASA